MYKKKELEFTIFILYGLAEKWKMLPAEVYKILNKTGILDDYVIACYDVLHTQGKEYLVEDITEFAREKGVNV
jgi:chloramphenicol O-acetyltransferase